MTKSIKTRRILKIIFQILFILNYVSYGQNDYKDITNNTQYNLHKYNESVIEQDSLALVDFRISILRILYDNNTVPIKNFPLSGPLVT